MKNKKTKILFAMFFALTISLSASLALANSKPQNAQIVLAEDENSETPENNENENQEAETPTSSETPTTSEETTTATQTQVESNESAPKENAKADEQITELTPKNILKVFYYTLRDALKDLFNHFKKLIKK